VIISSIQAGAYSNIIVSSFTTGDYENIQVGTATFATNAGLLNGNNSSAFVLLNATQSFSGYNTFGQVQASSITITGANVVLAATATYSLGATIANSLAAGVVSDNNISNTAAISGSKLASNLTVTNIAATGFVGLPVIANAATLIGITPSAKGQLYYAADISRVFVSTDTVTGSFSDISLPAVGPMGPSY
jgi:hypothetical protein